MRLKGSNFCAVTVDLKCRIAKFSKNLTRNSIRRWDSERELSLRRHRTRTTKYNRVVHKFRHRSMRSCVGTLSIGTKLTDLEWPWTA